MTVRLAKNIEWIISDVSCWQLHNLLHTLLKNFAHDVTIANRSEWCVYYYNQFIFPSRHSRLLLMSGQQHSSSIDLLKDVSNSSRVGFFALIIELFLTTHKFLKLRPLNDSLVAIIARFSFSAQRNVRFPRIRIISAVISLLSFATRLQFEKIEKQKLTIGMHARAKKTHKMWPQTHRPAANNSLC